VFLLNENRRRWISSCKFKTPTHNPARAERVSDMSAKRLTRKSFRVSLSWRMEILRLFITRKHANIFSNTKHVIINSVYIYWIKYKLNEIRRQYFFAVCLRIIRYVRSGKKYHVELITINACVKINFLK
jgi:hypothetical protein